MAPDYACDFSRAMSVIGLITMPRTISAEEACTNFPDLRSGVATTKQPVVVANGDAPVAVVISPEDYQLPRRQQDEKLWATVERIRARNAHCDPDEVYRDVTAIVEEIRQEIYDELRPNGGNHGANGFEVGSRTTHRRGHRRGFPN